MKKMCIAPFSGKEFSLLNSLKSSYEISALVSPPGIGREGEDVSVLRNETQTGIAFCNSIERGIEAADVVLISDVSPAKTALYKFACDALQASIAAGKEILCFLELSEEVRNSVLVKCSDFHAGCKFFLAPETIEYKAGEYLRLAAFNAPIFFVSELVPGCGGYDVFLNIAKQFRDLGKRVLAVSEDRYNQLFGYHYISFYSETNAKDKVFEINQQFLKLAKEVKPDVILVKLPYPVLPYDEKHLFDCGVFAYMISQALACSGCILCSPAQCLPASTWAEIGEIIQSRFRFPLLGIHISNQIIDASGNTDLALIHIPSSEVKPEIDALNDIDGCDAYQLLESDEVNKLCRKLIEDFLNLPYGVI